MFYLRGFDTDLFDELEHMRRRMDQMFGAWPAATGIRSGVAGSFPAVNVGGSADRVDVYLFVPGVDPKALDISMQQNLLTVSGERADGMPEEAQVYRNERFGGSFRRVLTLPEDVDPDKVDASFRDGVLHVSVQRREAVKPRQIEVK